MKVNNISVSFEAELYDGTKFIITPTIVKDDIRAFCVEKDGSLPFLVEVYGEELGAFIIRRPFDKSDGDWLHSLLSSLLPSFNTPSVWDVLQTKY